MIRLKHAAISLMFLVATAVACAPLGALAILSRIMERLDDRRWRRLERKSWLDG